VLKTEREFGLFDAIMMGLSGAIGFEIFVLLDYAYFQLAGPSIVSALLLGGLINMLIMLSYCELGAAMPKVGGEYTYIKTAYKGFTAFISGCFRWLASIFGAALAAISFTRQLAYFSSILSPAVQNSILAETPLIAVIVVMILATLEIKGTKKVGAIMVIALIAIFTIFISGGILRGLPPVEVLPKSLEGLPGAFAATVYMFPMFFGMRSLIAGAARIKNPGKNVPKGILLSALLVIPLYVTLAYVAVGVVPLGDYNEPFLNLAAENVMPRVGGTLFAVAGMVASLSALGTSLAVQSSIIRGMSRDGYLPKTLLSLHRRFGTPYVATISGSLFIMILSAVGAIEFLGYAASFGSILVFALVNLSLLKLRKDKPYMERPFKTPLYPFTPIAGVIMSMALLVFPIFIDVNAASALVSGIGLTAVVLATYYIRMMGRYRLQIALGGAGLGTGISLLVLMGLAEIGFISPTFPYIPSYVMLVVSAISIIAGILNVTTRG